MPPPLARAIAASVLAAMGKCPELARGILALGPTPLLHMDMSEASRFWGVANPIGRRDRKSGIRKRKQVDIEAFHLKQLSYA